MIDHRLEALINKSLYTPSYNTAKGVYDDAHTRINADIEANMCTPALKHNAYGCVPLGKSTQTTERNHSEISTCVNLTQF